MKIALKKLHLVLRKTTVQIEFPRITYFYGPIGSGKSSIGRLIDFCFGGNARWTPALQAEMIRGDLECSFEGQHLELERDKESNQMVVSWQSGDEILQLLVPAKDALGEVWEETGVETLSDLLFFLAKEDAPYVRRRKGRPDERLERLSFRDLFKFCYLDQDSMDNVFFRLDSENHALRAKSVDAMRYVLGYKSEQVAELESQLQHVREERLGMVASAQALAKALNDAGLDDAAGYEQKIDKTRAAIDRALATSAHARANRQDVPHAAVQLRNLARGLAEEETAVAEAIDDVMKRIGGLERQWNELQMLSLRFQRNASARMILGGVDFSSCPRCTQELPVRSPAQCQVCGQPDHITGATGILEEPVIEEDLKARQVELKDTLSRMRTRLQQLEMRATDLSSQRTTADRALDARMREYDTTFLSQALQHEREVVTLQQQLDTLLRYRKLPDVLEEQREGARGLALDEVDLRSKIEQMKRLAFNDRNNVDLLGALFLDCLVRIKFPDVKREYHVEIDVATFYPQIPLGVRDALVVLSFDNAGSGGMKALFKTCFALALHRVCAKIGDSKLPPILIIDTPTKNVSSVENPEVIALFFRLVYELADSELSQTQFIIVENELNPVPRDINLPLTSRHMVRGNKDFPPLIPYLLGDFSQS